MPVRKLAKIVGAAFRDADLARKTSADPKWRKEQMKDRRGTLRKFETVEHALQDRVKPKAKAKAKADHEDRGQEDITRPGVEYRALATGEHREAAQLFFDSLTALAIRHNAPPPPPELVDEEEAGYKFVDRTGIFRVAALDGRLVSLACAILRDDEWFLSGFWTSPHVRQQGVGGPLLRQVWDEGVGRGARRQFVWASIDPTAIATYMKFGMLPGSQLFAFSGSPRADPGAGSDTVPLTPEQAASIDRTIRGVPRAVDHEWWAHKAGVIARAVTKGGRVAGYYYVDKGQIGPAAWLAPEDGTAVLHYAMHEASGRAAEVKIVVPGMNRLALETALASGLRLVRNSHLLWTEPFGRMEQYIPSGPLLF